MNKTFFREGKLNLASHGKLLAPNISLLKYGSHCFSYKKIKSLLQTPHFQWHKMTSSWYTSITSLTHLFSLIWALSLERWSEHCPFHLHSCLHPPAHLPSPLCPSSTFSPGTLWPTLSKCLHCCPSLSPECLPCVSWNYGLILNAHY